MRSLLGCIALGLVLAGGPIGAALGDGPGVRVDRSFGPLLGRPPLASPGGIRQRAPQGHDHGRRSLRPQIYCDVYGRCFQRLPDRPFGAYGYYGDRPPGWADDLPGRIRYPGRFQRPSSGVVCDRATYICYRNGVVDKSETRDVFGDRAADRADGLRDARGTGRIFVPERGVTCDTAQKVCFDGRTPDTSLTKRYFGADAARRLF